MIAFDDLGKYRRARLWIDERPDIPKLDVESTERFIESDTFQIWSRREVGLELASPRHCSSYALLGIRYCPSNGSRLRIKLLYNIGDPIPYEDNLSMISDKVYMGISKEYAKVILGIAEEKAKELKYPPGRLDFMMGAYGEVGSGIMIFQAITKMVMEILPTSHLRKSRLERRQQIETLLEKYYE